MKTQHIALNVRPKRRNHERWCRNRLRRLQVLAHQITVRDDDEPRRLDRVLYRIFALKREIRLIEYRKLTSQ